MPKNANTAHRNEHAGFMGTSGCGKSSALRVLLPRSNARVVLWDIDRDHRAHHCDSMVTFIRELKRANRSGKPFRLAYSGNATPLMFAIWCRAVWAILDGAKITYCVVEELADVEASAGKACAEWGTLLRRGRKYGARVIWVTQRPSEISKTAVSQAGVLWISTQGTHADIDSAAKYAGLGSAGRARVESMAYHTWLLKRQGIPDPEYRDMRQQQAALHKTGKNDTANTVDVKPF